MKLKVSVVIPAHNEAKDIAKCLDSLMRQTIAPNEIIVVNNNSTDSTAEIALSYKGVRVINEKNKGITYARTAGFNAARYDIIARTDADTIVSDKWVESIIKAFSQDKNACGLIGHQTIREFSPGRTFLFGRLGRFCRIIGDIAVSPSVGGLMSGHNMAIRRSAWEKISNLVHLGDQNINEDVDLSLFIKKVGKIIYCRDMVAKTRMFEAWFNFPKIIRYIKTNKITLKKHRSLELDEINFQ